MVSLFIVGTLAAATWLDYSSFEDSVVLFISSNSLMGSLKLLLRLQKSFCCNEHNDLNGEPGIDIEDSIEGELPSVIRERAAGPILFL